MRTPMNHARTRTMLHRDLQKFRGLRHIGKRSFRTAGASNLRLDHSHIDGFSLPAQDW